jgi:hypothetical protein
MPVYRYLDLSTGHLTEEEANELVGGHCAPFAFTDLARSPRVVAHESGAWVQLPARECEGGDWGDLDAETLLSTRPNLARLQLDQLRPGRRARPRPAHVRLVTRTVAYV